MANIRTREHLQSLISEYKNALDIYPTDLLLNKIQGLRKSINTAIRGADKAEPKVSSNLTNWAYNIPSYDFDCESPENRLNSEYWDFDKVLEKKEQEFNLLSNSKSSELVLVNQSTELSPVQNTVHQAEPKPFKLSNVIIIKYKALTAIEALYFPTTINTFKNEMNILILNHENPVKEPRLVDKYRKVIKEDFPNEVSKLFFDGFPIPIKEYFEVLIPLYERIKALIYVPIEDSNAPHNEIYGALRDDFLRDAELYLSTCGKVSSCISCKFRNWSSL